MGHFTLKSESQMSDLPKNYRLRLPSGKKVNSPSQILEYIEIVALKNHPSTPKELSLLLAKSVKQIHRYLNALLDMKKIIKIEGSSRYKLIDDTSTKKSVDLTKQINSMSEFYETESVKQFLENCTTKNKNGIITFIGRICTGQRFKDFKIHPDNWMHPETTKEIIRLQRELTNKDRIYSTFRIMVRAWLSNGLGISLESNTQQLIKMGLDGDKDKPKASKLHMTKEQYNAVIKNLENDKTSLCKFAFRYWTFCRPSSMYIVKTDDLIFYDRTIKYIQLNGDKITDPHQVEILSKDYPIKTFTHRSAMLQDLKEYKTDETYQKFIYDEKLVKELEQYQKERKEGGYSYLFWDKNETNFNFENYDSIVVNQVNIDNKIFKEIFLKSGFNRDDFSEHFRANYALRHFGVQWWLQATDYDYGLIASMGWKDINTLREWYGGYTAEHFEKKISGIFPS